MATGNKIVTLVAALVREKESMRREELATSIYSAIKTRLVWFIRQKVYESEVDDVVAESLKAIFSSLERFKGTTDDKFEGWYLRIARNKAVDQRRKRRDWGEIEELTLDDIETKVEASFLKSPVLPGEELDLKLALNLLKKLKAKCRRLLLAHFVTGLEVKEIAKLLKLKYATALRRIDRCLDSAKDVFDGYEF